MSLAELFACLLHRPIRTLEQPLVFTAPLGMWSW